MAKSGGKLGPMGTVIQKISHDGGKGMTNQTAAEVRETVACADCGLRRHHTSNQCTKIQVARARLEQAKEARGWIEAQISDLQRDLRIAESLGEPVMADKAIIPSRQVWNG